MKKILIMVCALAAVSAFADNTMPPTGSDDRSAPPTTMTSPSDTDPGTIEHSTTTTTQSSRRTKRTKKAIKPESPHAGAARPDANAGDTEDSGGPTNR